MDTHRIEPRQTPTPCPVVERPCGVPWAELFHWPRHPLVASFAHRLDVPEPPKTSRRHIVAVHGLAYEAVSG